MHQEGGREKTEAVTVADGQWSLDCRQKDPPQLDRFSLQSPVLTSTPCVWRTLAGVPISTKQGSAVNINVNSQRLVHKRPWALVRAIFLSAMLDAIKRTVLLLCSPVGSMSVIMAWDGFTVVS